MNKIERMKTVFADETPDYTPAGFWFHYPTKLDAKQTAQAHLGLYRQLDNDIIKIMDDSFGRMVTGGIKERFTRETENRRLIYTTNATKGFNRQLCKVTKAKSAFPTDDGLLKMLYLAMIGITRKWTGRTGA